MATDGTVTERGLALLSSEVVPVALEWLDASSMVVRLGGNGVVGEAVGGGGTGEGSAAEFMRKGRAGGAGEGGFEGVGEVDA